MARALPVKEVWRLSLMENNVNHENMNKLDDANVLAVQEDANTAQPALAAKIGSGENQRNFSDKIQWYVIHTYAGYEAKVKANLEKRVESMNMEGLIFRVVVPMENEVQIKNGKKKVIPRKVYPGYVLVEMLLTDTSWYVVRNTPGVTGFVGTGAKPVPLHDSEAEHILEQMGYMEDHFKVSFKAGDSVRIIAPPFENFIGLVEDVYPERGKLKVSVSMFGRETLVELEFFKVEEI